ncbi:MAG: altronate dehydratase [Candidatus Omnitrophota bacterium]
MERNFESVALIMNPVLDQVAIAKEDIPAGTRLTFNGDIIKLKTTAKRGSRFVVTDVRKGEYLRQYGYPFGCSKGILKGELISVSNIENLLPETNLGLFEEPPKTMYNERFLNRTFLGYLRKDGFVGTRNYYLVVPTSMCVSETAFQITMALEADKEIFKQYPSLDGIVTIPHTEGCGCDSIRSIDRLMCVLKGYIGHPNVGGCLIIDLGCEQTNYEKMYPYLKSTVREKLKPIDWITVEKSGGVKATRKKADAIIRGRLSDVANVKREPFSLEKLIVATECGASDSFSGITANPIIGNVVDKIISGKGSAILSEIPEMIGAFEMLLPRFRNLEVANKFKDAVDWYINIAERLGLTLQDNLVPKNIEGGLINNYIKSLGAVLKGGTSVIEDVIDYAESVKTRGLSIMQGPGGDPESVTGMVASGANIVCFSTGQGTPTGNAICPVVKVASNEVIFETLSDDMDFGAGRLLTGQVSIDSLSDELLDFVIEVASGRETAAEKLGQRQFQVWTAGKLSL